MGLVLRNDAREELSDNEDTVEIVAEPETDGSDDMNRPVSSRAGFFLGASLMDRRLSDGGLVETGG